jgi:hypothetical protein
MKTIAGIKSIVCIAMFSGPAFAQIPIQINAAVPASLDNSTAPWFPPVVDQGARESCGNATGIGYGFSYEINASRSVSGKDSSNQYPFFATYDFLNEGCESCDPDKTYYRHFLPAWKIARENGIPAVRDFGSPDLNSTRWMTGYDNYYRAMRNRVDKIDSFEVSDTASLRKMKQWLFDRGSGSPSGGIFIFTANIYGTQEDTVHSGPESGKTFIKFWGNDQTSGHCMAMVGYNDSVRYDFNGDGKYTTTLDIGNDAGAIGTKDGTVDMADWEIGAFKAANSWGTSEWDNGFAWVPYRSFVISPLNGGLLSGGRVYYLTVRKNYTPRMALKISITDPLRNTFALSVGVSDDPSAAVPAKLRVFDRQFTYSGGAYPMCGKGASASIEIGLDISDLIDSIPGAALAKFFLVIESKGGSGFVDSLSLMDYTSGTLKQTASSQTPVSITAGSSANPALTYLSVLSSINAVLPAADRIFSKKNISIRRANGDVRIALPGSRPGRFGLFDSCGKLRACLSVVREGEWIGLPRSLPGGVYFIHAVAGDRKTPAWEVRL